MRVILGQSAKRFLPEDSSRPLVLGGLIIPDHEGLMDNLDGDVVLQSLCQAISAVTGFKNYLQIVEDLIEKDGITDSTVLLDRCLNFDKSFKISQVSFSIEAKKPLLDDYIDQMHDNMAKLLKLGKDRVAISWFEAHGLSDISCGDGISVLCALTITD